MVSVYGPEGLVFKLLGLGLLCLVRFWVRVYCLGDLGFSAS